MASTFGPRLLGRSTRSVPTARHLGRRMTWHAAAALLVFAALQIWLVSGAIAVGAPSALTIVALILLLALAVPVARITERRWYRMSRQALASWGLHARFRREVTRLWIAALLLPVLWVGVVTAATAGISVLGG